MSVKQQFPSYVRQVRDILEDMRNRDPRFELAYEACFSFWREDAGFRRALNRAQASSSKQTAMPTRLKWMGVDTAYTVNENTYLAVSVQALGLVIDSAIYDILDVFGTAIDPCQVPHKWVLQGHIALLDTVWAASKGRSPRTREVPTEKLQQGDSYDQFKYNVDLASATKNIRVIRIFPGTGESTIRCKLEKLDIADGGTYDALSYVWGKDAKDKVIWVDDQPFSITLHLYEILINLRSWNTDTVIWIDAICINQADNNERTHQVGLMRHIYSQAKSIIIWLGGQAADDELKAFQEPNLLDNPHNVLWPLPTELVGTTLDQYDLLAILEAARTHDIESDHWDEKTSVVFLALLHCLNAILSCDWWERIWTIQEAVLPTAPPTFRFRGHSFSFDDLEAAIEFASRSPDEIPRGIKQLDILQPRTEFLDTSVINQWSMFERFKKSLLVYYLRREKQWSTDMPDPRVFFNLLPRTSRHRSSDPRDKIFALESLLARHQILPFVHIDYNETPEKVFGRVTAMWYNQSLDLHITSQYGLYVESEMAKKNTPTCPSWVLDLTYSDAELYQTGLSDIVTFAGAIMAEDLWGCKNIDVDRGRDQIELHRPCFATPTTLFCSGFCIGVICKTGIIPQYTPIHDIKRFASFIADTAMSLPTSGFFTGLLLKTELTARIVNFFTLNTKNRQVFGPPKGDIYYQRRKEIGGKFYFFTETGLLGIVATAPQVGDMIALISVSPVYWVLREVKNEDKTATQQHRMVARALVHANPDETKAFLAQDSVDNCCFQIV